MLQILFFYIGLPFLAAFLLIRFIQKRAPSRIPPDVSALVAADPIEKRSYRAARRDAKGLFKLADFEGHEQAVDAIYNAREEARKRGEKAAFIVLDAKGETLDWIDS